MFNIYNLGLELCFVSEILLYFLSLCVMGEGLFISGPFAMGGQKKYIGDYYPGTYRRCPTCISLAMLGDDISMMTRRRGPMYGGRTPFCRSSESSLET